MGTVAARPAALAEARQVQPLKPRYWPFALPAVLVTLVVLLPFLWLAILSFFEAGAFSLVHYERMLENASYASILSDTLLLSLLVTGIVVALGIPTTYVIVRQPPMVATIMLACVAIPFWTSLLVRTYAWMVLLQRKGLINTWLLELGVIDRPLRMANSFSGTTIGMVHIMLPFFIFPLYSAMRQIDPDMVKAARSLGASSARAFWGIFLPLAMPGIMAGALLSFVLCLGFYVTPQLLGGGNVTTISMKIQQNVTMYSEWGASSALGVVLLVLVLACFLATQWMVPRRLRS
ncbi:MAG TPA: ABC transporter permease [Geminicoccus sp.]|jgi:putative spermidine/putrescine transport system permease protein/spermidine/putrescine transport system permease protein|uniref:ABC transporter permease n=1 Tax=Geminicoccus sp. TaxID=2024832 RepID=UPI002E359DCF|nr:ABC transporter permease [Geminicoccus sp.]HEX2526277.1 ABC transporter permease [Geminicoccus sp.]